MAGSCYGIFFKCCYRRTPDLWDGEARICLGQPEWKVGYETRYSAFNAAAVVLVGTHCYRGVRYRLVTINVQALPERRLIFLYEER